jgi:hypothetical protein
MMTPRGAKNTGSFHNRASGSCFDFSLGPVTSSHTPIGNFNLSFTVGSHGVPFGRGIPISGYGLSDLITIGLSERGIGQQQTNYNGNQDPGHLRFPHE